MNKREILSKIKNLEGLSQDERSYLVDLINTKKKYGLVWENQTEDVEEILRTKLPILKEVKERRIPQLNSDGDYPTEDKNFPNHILIEGDNLHALTSLTFTHEDSIDLIYIDPPYNTGSKEDFIFNDDYVDKENDFRHSKWLSFINKRLNIAKQLMAEDGVIFISIGDDEIAQLILLCNEVFGENNQLGIVARVAKTAGDKGSFFAPSKDYVIAYAKNRLLVSDFKDDVDDSLFKKTETSGPKEGEKYRDDVAFYQSSLDPMRGCTNQRYWVKAPDGSYVIPPGKVFPSTIGDAQKIVPETKDDKVWRWSEETYQKKKELLVFKKTTRSPLVDEKGKRSKYNIYTKSYLIERSSKGKSPRDYLDQYINRKGADFIKQYDIDFSFSKPYELIEHFIKISNKSNNIKILDFFAGSGTTLHSVLNLNKQDNGSRECIIITNNENNICDNVTYPRIKRIIEGYTNQKDKVMPSFPENNLFVYKTDTLNSEPSLMNKRKVTKNATDLICIKENCYWEVNHDLGFTQNQAQIFTNNNGKYLVAIYHSRNQLEIQKKLLEWIQNLENVTEMVKIYAFSPEKEVLVEEFKEVSDKVDVVPLPEFIYNTYLTTIKNLDLNNN